MVNNTTGSTTFEFFQTGGADETLEAAKKKFSQTYGALVTDIKFEYAYPGNSEGRWVGLRVTFQPS